MDENGNTIYNKVKNVSLILTAADQKEVNDSMKHDAPAKAEVKTGVEKAKEYVNTVNNPPAPPKPETDKWALIEKKNDDRENRYVVRHEAMLDAMYKLTTAITTLTGWIESMNKTLIAKNIEVINKSNSDKSFLQKVATEQIESGKAALKNAKTCATLEAEKKAMKDLEEARKKNESSVE
jgi:hypothetical protein